MNVNPVESIYTYKNQNLSVCLKPTFFALYWGVLGLILGVLGLILGVLGLIFGGPRPYIGGSSYPYVNLLLNNACTHTRTIRKRAAATTQRSAKRHNDAWLMFLITQKTDISPTLVEAYACFFFQIS